MTARDYMSRSDLAAALGVSVSAVNKWRIRYPAGSEHPFPAPDVMIGGDVPGWAHERLDEIEAWRGGLPGRGAGGGRPRKTAQAE